MVDCPEKLVPQPGPLHLVAGDWTRFTWPDDWVTIHAKDFVHSHPEILVAMKYAMANPNPPGEWSCQMYSFLYDMAPENWDEYDFMLSPGDDVSIYSSAEMDIYPECTPGTVETEGCWDGSQIEKRTCNDQYQWVLSGQVCPVAEPDYTLLLVGGGIVLVLVALLGK